MPASMLYGNITVNKYVITPLMAFSDVTMLLAGDN